MSKLDAVTTAVLFLTVNVCKLCTYIDSKLLYLEVFSSVRMSVNLWEKISQGCLMSYSDTVQMQRFPFLLGDIIPLYLFNQCLFIAYPMNKQTERFPFSLEVVDT
jgi:hypothetical protein